MHGSTSLENSVRRAREGAGLSQQDLAERVGVSRQAIIAIEAGRQVPSTLLGLRLARALGTSVEDLFRVGSGEVAARLAPLGNRVDGTHQRSRVAVGEVGGRWVAHRLPADAGIAADGLISASAVERTALVRPLADPERLRRNVLVAGCAPLLGTLARHIGDRSGAARATWLEAGSTVALDLLRDGFVHVAGIHGGSGSAREGNEAVVRRALPGMKALLVGFTRWRLGFVVPAGNPLQVRTGADLLRPGLRLALRERGTGAEKLVRSLLAAEGAEGEVLTGVLATGHAEVAQLVRCGAADAGIAIESVALGSGLGFVPLVEEGFDLVVPAELADSSPIVQLFEALDDPNFRADAGEIPGYDTEACGHVKTLEAA